MKVLMGGSEIGDDKSEEYVKKQETDEGLHEDEGTYRAPRNSADRIYRRGDPSQDCQVDFARFKTSGGGEIDPVSTGGSRSLRNTQGRLLTSHSGSLGGPARATETCGSFGGPARVKEGKTLTSHSGSLGGPAACNPD
jgi:hypothetical protein